MPKLSVVETPIPAAIATLAADFLADCRARGLSVRSVEHYANSLEWHFLPWCAREGVADPSQLTTQLAGRFTTHLLEEGGKHGQPLARASVRSYVQGVRVFLGWAGSAEGGAVTVGASPKLPKANKPLFDVLNRSELQAMEDAAKTERDKLILRLLADCGIRLGELLGMRAEDIREARKGEFGILVHGKGAKDRLVPVAPALYRRLRHYLAGRRAEGQDRVFASLRKGADGRHAPLTDSGVEQVIRLLAKEAGITKRVYPHLIRHSFATEWLRKGGNIISLQRVLGHADLSMIQGVYAHLDSSDDYQAAMAVLLGKD
ncbi:MAG TPA: tyrosine-type recombinase/integrase [Candidatus Micrarchaeaceae archaeon]|nr:tyrosine-type recombinase/integrase [Candidatus Micrarchaeaceae archaeon]